MIRPNSPADSSESAGFLLCGSCRARLTFIRISAMILSSGKGFTSKK